MDFSSFYFSDYSYHNFLTSWKVIDKKKALAYRESENVGAISEFTDKHNARYEDFGYIMEYSCKDCREWIIIDKETLTLSESDKAFEDCDKRLEPLPN